jgi:ubiquinone/menaquinone biosynthesis C-methylase UbiE
VLAQEGMSVTNVDPGEAGFTVRRRWVDAANAVFDTAVRLYESRLQDVPLADQSFDAVVCISTLEHISLNEIMRILSHVRRVLRRDGRFILTVDLFPNLFPFTRREYNEFGTNVPVWRMLTTNGFDIVAGEPTECFSAPGFEPVEILSRLEEFAVGEDYPAMVDTLVARPV